MAHKVHHRRNGCRSKPYLLSISTRRLVKLEDVVTPMGPVSNAGGSPQGAGNTSGGTLIEENEPFEMLVSDPYDD